jgi:choline dehydrogenase-like flavoprotein
MIQMGKPGRGFHSGGSFPMSAEPHAGETDILGRPHGLRRIHAIDSTVLPSIPATTITFTVMANAYRIGTLAAAERKGS